MTISDVYGNVNPATSVPGTPLIGEQALSSSIQDAMTYSRTPGDGITDSPRLINQP